MSRNTPELNPVQDGQLAIATIVLATDFSAASRNAGDYAAMLARHFQAELIIAHAFVLTQSAIEVETLKQIPSEDRLIKLRQLDEIADHFRRQGLSVCTKLLIGEPAQTLPDFADMQTRPLLVLGTQSDNTVERVLLGSTAEGCLRRAACPTVTVGRRVPSLQQSRGFRSIVYATDCSGMASHAAPLAWAMARSFASELRVITVVEEHHAATTEVLANLDFRTRQQLEQQLGSKCEPALETRTVASHARARGEILKYTEKVHGDLIILGVHRRASIELFDRNSVTIQLIEQSSCPVLTLTRAAVPGSAAPDSK